MTQNRIETPNCKKRNIKHVTPDNDKGQNKMAFFVKPKRTRETLSTKTQSFTLVDPNYFKEYLDTMPYDIVISFASDIDHPDYLSSIIPCH